MEHKVDAERILEKQKKQIADLTFSLTVAQVMQEDLELRYQVLQNAYEELQRNSAAFGSAPEATVEESAES